MTEPIMRVENLHHTYFAGTPRAIPALRGVSFAVQPSEYLAIIGHNGSGKSTLAKHLNGLLLPTQGDVWVKTWNTRNAQHRIDIRSTVGMVFQTPDNQIVATMVEEDVAFGPENLGVPRAEIVQRVDWSLDAVEMQKYRHRAPHLLSGGQKQRVAIAGILALKPQVLVLDESTALLDPLGREEVLRVARRLNEQGTTIIAITHLMAEAALAHRVIVMENGALALQGTPREIFAQANRLRELQLDVPAITELGQRLKLGTVISVDEFVDAMRDRRRLTADRVVSLRAAERRSNPQMGLGNQSWGLLRRHPSPPLRTPPRNDAVSRPPSAVISIDHLEHTYLRHTPLESIALRDVNFQVGRGEIVGIIGHTGSGKSTLVQHLNGLLRPQRGSVRVLDYDLCDAKIDVRKLRQRVGLVFQFPEAQLFEQFVGDDVAFAPWQMGLRGEDLRTRVREAMNVVGLPFEAFKDRPLYSLSGGERRRVAIAGVIAMKPEILVLDEPTAGLDPRGHQDILNRLLKLRDEWQMTLVLVSHNMEDIARLCDRVYVIANGKTEMSGTPREIFAAPQRLLDLGLGVPQVTAAMHALRARGFAVRTDVLTVEEAVEQWDSKQ